VCVGGVCVCGVCVCYVCVCVCGVCVVCVCVVCVWCVCVCETLSLTLKKDHRVRVFENRMPREIFGPKKVGITREWKRLHNEKLNDMQC